MISQHWKGEKLLPTLCYETVNQIVVRTIYSTDYLKSFRKHWWFL